MADLLEKVLGQCEVAIRRDAAGLHVTARGSVAVICLAAVAVLLVRAIG